jgi:hypothetical protein
MTAAHAKKIAHPVLADLFGIVGDAWTLWVWHPFLLLAGWFSRHVFGSVVSLVTAAFTTALGMAFMVTGLPVVSVVVFVVAIAVTARVAYKMGRAT